MRQRVLIVVRSMSQCGRHVRDIYVARCSCEGRVYEGVNVELVE